MTAGSVWLLGVLLAPIAVAMASLSTLQGDRLRQLAVAGATLLLAACTAPLFVDVLATMRVPWPGWLPGYSGADAFRLNTLSSALVPLPGALWLLTVVATPRSMLDRAGVRRTALATLATTLAFSTENPALLVLFWTASSAWFLTALSAPEHRRARRVAALYLLASGALLVVGVVLMTGAWGPPAAELGLWLVLVAALIRKGIFPFHAWVPEVFDRGRLGPAVLFCAPQLGSYVTVILIVPHATPEMLRWAAVLALGTAVYGASLALFQRDARRACGYLFVSQSALVMAGLDCTSGTALTGSLVLWISSAVAFGGMGRCVLVLEARLGRLDLGEHHGAYEQMPLLAASFLTLGLACTGFPGTLGFVGEELLVEGAVTAFPVLGFCVIAAGAFTGIAVLRMYFSLFCGAGHRGAGLNLLRREGIAFACVAAFLILFGLFPGPLSSNRYAAANAILQQRHEGESSR